MHGQSEYQISIAYLYSFRAMMETWNFKNIMWRW